MRRAQSAPSLDITIRGDELEQNRIQLEHNLQHTDLSLHLSSAPEENSFGDDDHDESDVEYPRHNSGPSAFDAFASFDNPSNFDGDHSQLHPWSYHTDDDGVNPYGGETASTAAHHASALTLSAGLGLGRGARRDVSFSGAEYDPERPLHDIIAGVDSRFSLFDVEASKSRYPPAVTFDPLVVDSTAELDRVLRSGHRSTTIPHLRSPQSSSSSSVSDSENAAPSRLKLSEQLQRVAFSPKRPRSAQSTGSVGSPRSPLHAQPISVHHAPPSPPLDAGTIPTPKPRSRQQTSSKPNVRVQPPTPSTTGSKFTKMARGLTKEIEAEAEANSHRMQKRRPFGELGNRRQGEKRVALPDVTGLTDAVESPMKPVQPRHWRYDGGDGVNESEARLLNTLTTVQTQLAHLEEQNSVSRRRVRELEMELEGCKRDVRRERTRVEERESVIAGLRRESEQDRKGKGRQVEAVERYRQVVEEKKALEALIGSLRTHLTRLTTELSSHKQLLGELRSLRDSDARKLTEKGVEVDRLKEEVERLGGEVEVLKGVVEEGLRERRVSRAMSAGGEEPGRFEDQTLETESKDEHEPQLPAIPSSGLIQGLPPDRTIRTDHATLGSSNVPVSAARKFADSIELERISVELEERKSNSSHQTCSRSQAPSPKMHHEVDSGRAISPSGRPSLARRQPKVLSSHPTAPTPMHASRRAHHEKQDGLETPFPQIRGGHLERLFFSAPEHNANACNICHRRRRRSDVLPMSSLPLRKMRTHDQDHDSAGESNDEGLEHTYRAPKNSKAKGKQREQVVFVDKGLGTGSSSQHSESGPDRVPPQTVLVRVLRELEDDFTHYKSIYVELADQYKHMDAMSNVPRRNTLAQHLREVIDVLEQKGDQIASLYDLLVFKDKPVSESIIPPK